MQAGRRGRERSQIDAGFTLVELMVVLVIIGLLATVVVINVLPAQDQAMVEKARADIRTIEQGLELYRIDNLAYPGTGDGLEALTRPPETGRAANIRREGYIKRLPQDPWGNPYQYIYPGEQATFDLYSLGADGQIGGEGLNADIGNWSQN